MESAAAFKALSGHNSVRIALVRVNHDGWPSVVTRRCDGSEIEVFIFLHYSNYIQMA